MKVLLLGVFAFLVFAQCPNQNSDKELALKEKELELKEKELELKEKELELKAEEKEDKKDEDKKKKEKPKPAPAKKANLLKRRHHPVAKAVHLPTV